jgi:hypothetical protein
VLFKALPISFQHRFWARRIWSLYWRKEVTLDLVEGFGREAGSVAPELLRMAQDQSEFQHLRLRALSLLRGNPDLETEIEPLARDFDAQVRNQAASVVRSLRRSKENRERSQTADLIKQKGSTQDSRATLFEPLWKPTDGLFQEKK